MRFFLKFLWACLLIVLSVKNIQAQVLKPDDHGKTYYDSSYSQVCEVFHYLLQYQFLPDIHTNEKKFVKVVSIKDGPYLSYHINGKLASAGYYVQNEKDSVWKYYSLDGDLVHTELYRDAKLIK